MKYLQHGVSYTAKDICKNVIYKKFDRFTWFDMIPDEMEVEKTEKGLEIIGVDENHVDYSHKGKDHIIVPMVYQWETQHAFDVDTLVKKYNQICAPEDKITVQK